MGRAADPVVASRCGRLPKAAGRMAHTDCDGGRRAGRGAAVSGRAASTPWPRGRRIIRWRMPIARSSRCRTTRLRERWPRCCTPKRPEDNYFSLSEPGTIAVLDNGRTRFAPSPWRQASLPDRQARSEGARSGYVREVGHVPATAASGRGRRRGGAAALMLLAQHAGSGSDVWARPRESAGRVTSSTAPCARF